MTQIIADNKSLSSVLICVHLRFTSRLADNLKQMALIYSGYTWRHGRRYTIQRHGESPIDVHRPFFAPTTWSLDETEFSLRCGSNTSSTLHNANRAKVGEIHQSCRHWDIEFEGERFTLHILKRGYVLRSPLRALATLMLNSKRQITCTYSNAKRAPMDLLIYVVVYLRISLE